MKLERVGLGRYVPETLFGSGIPVLKKFFTYHDQQRKPSQHLGI